MSTLTSLFTFRLINTWLAIEPDSVVTILDPQRYIPLPLAPTHVLGLIPHGQTILPVFHLSLFLKMSGFEVHNATTSRLLVIKKNQLEVAIPINQIGGVETMLEKVTSSTILTRNGRLQDFLLSEYEGLQGFTGILNIETVLERARV